MNTVSSFTIRPGQYGDSRRLILMFLVTSPGFKSKVGSIVIGLLFWLACYSLYAALSKTNNFSQQPTLTVSLFADS